MPLLERISRAVRGGRYEGGPHIGTRQTQKVITIDEIKVGVGQDAPEIIEIDPADARGPSCLIRGELLTGDVIHVVVGYSELHYHPESDDEERSVFLITCYRPDPRIWADGFRKRRRHAN